MRLQTKVDMLMIMSQMLISSQSYLCLTLLKLKREKKMKKNCLDTELNCTG